MTDEIKIKDIKAIRRENMAKARAAKELKARNRDTPVVENRAREAAVEREPMRDTRWDSFQYAPTEDDDRLKILPEEIPDGMSYQWITAKIFGQDQPQNLARFQKQGWIPVPASRHDGKFAPKGYQGYCEVDGLILHERPMEFTRRAREHEFQKARGQVQIRERQLAGGDIPGVGFDTQHPSALRANVIKKGFERITVPEE